MPSYDQILQISEPTGQETFTFDYGHQTTAWHDASLEVVPDLTNTQKRVDPSRRIRDLERGRLSTYDRFQLQADGDNPYLAWGASALPGNAQIPNANEAPWFNGFAVGTPGDMDIARLEMLFPDDTPRPVMGTIQFAAYASSTDPRSVASIGSTPLSLESVRRLAEGVYDFRLNFLAVPRDGSPWGGRMYGVTCEVTLALAERVHSHWGRLLASGGLATTLQVSQTDVDAITETRAYETRYSPNIGVFSAIIAEGEHWTVTGVDEIGRKRTMRVECERTVRRAAV